MAKSSSGKPADRAAGAGKINGFILAGGRSVRMGQDKANLEWRGRTLLDHMTSILSEACATVRIVGREPLADRIPHHGPLGGIATALGVTDTARNLIVAVDLPLLEPSFLRWLAARTLASSQRITVCRAGSRYPLCLGIDRSLAASALQRVESNKLALREFIDASDPEIVPEGELQANGFSTSMFDNLNSPEDFQRLYRRS